MTKPLIGISTYSRSPEDRFFLPGKYIDTIVRAGGEPILLVPAGNDFDRLLSILDGYILPGGGDVDPALHGGGDHPKVYGVSRERDRFEMKIARRALDSGLPTLCICRGFQLLNVALGGTLHLHLPDVFGRQVIHRLPDKMETPHSVEVEPSSALAGIYQKTSFVCSSSHHQGIKDLAEGLKAVAFAPDGVIEAVEVKGHPWLHAVQWHPEHTSAKDPVQQRIFGALIAAASPED